MSKGIAAQHRKFDSENQKPMRILLTFLLTSIAGSCLGQVQTQCQAVDGNCINGNVGYALVKIVSGTQPFTYLWSNGESTDSIFNLNPGTYSVTVTDGNGHTADCAITVTSEGCCNVTEGGEIEGMQSNCTVFDPGPISNTFEPTGGFGELEYIWLRGYCGTPTTSWGLIPGADSASYDPPFISEETCFMRACRRSGCTVYLGESNIITISIEPSTPNIYPVASSVICNGSPAKLRSTFSSEYLWSTGETTQDIFAQDTGWYYVINACGDTSDHFYVGEAELDPPVIEELSPCEFSVVNYADSLNYQWYRWSIPIVNSTGQVNSDSLHGNYSVLARSSNGCVLQSNQIFCFNNTSVEEENGNKLKIFPNPVKDQLFIKTEERLTHYSIFSILGEMVLSGTIRGNENLDVSGLDGGLYVIRLNGESGEAVRRFVKVD